MVRSVRLAMYPAIVAVVLYGSSALGQASVAAGAARVSPPHDSLLRAITTRGRALAAYDAAAWLGSDALVALRPDTRRIGRYIARPGGAAGAHWTVVFGRSNVQRDTFFVAYEARGQAGPDSVHGGYTAVAHPVVLADTGYYRRAALAIDTAVAEFGRADRRYNVAALPTATGEWWVYLVPAPTIAGVWPLGGDTRYRIAADGRTILERRRLHRSIIDFDARPQPGSTDGPPTIGYHTAVLDNLPEDTDVFYVLTRRPFIPELVLTDAFVYEVSIDGTIKFLGRREDVLKQ